MAARQGSLAWVLIAGTISIGIAGVFWALMDSAFVAELVATDSWSASAGTVPSLARDYVTTAWDWLLLIVLLRAGIESLVASRLVGVSSVMPKETVVLIMIHLLILMWALVFPEIGGELYEIASNTPEVAAAGYMEGVTLAWEWGFGILPAVLLVIADGWFLSAPIRNDMLGVPR